MRIVHVLTRMLRAGSEENTAETCRWQAAAGHEVLLIHGAEIDPWWNDNPIPGVRMIGCPTIVHQVNPVADARALTALRTIYRDLMPDVIHTHQSKAGVLGRLAADTLPQALVVHGIHIVPFEGVSLGNSGPLSHPRQVVAFHDAHLFELPEAFSPGYRLWHRALRPRLARRARTLVTVSHHAAGQLAQHLSVPRSRFRNLPNSAEHILRVAPDPAVLSRSGLRREGYILAVGNQSPNKNIARLVAAHATDPDLPPLAVAGGFAPGVAGAAIGGSDRVIPLGRVSDGELRALYEGARGFAFPSLHEGFGIPPLEAMALGTPVLCSARAALPEVLGEAPIWCDPLDTGDLAKGLALLARLDGDERAERIAAGFDRSAALTWRASAAGLIDLLLEDLEGRAGLSFPMGAEPAGLSAQ